MMTPQEIATITKERLDRWAALMNKDHATPMMLLAVGHDHRSGETFILIPEDTTDKQIRQMLAGAIEQLNRRN